MQNLTREAGLMAGSIADGLGFDPLPIITILLPMVLQCLGVKSGQGLQDLAVAHYDSEAGEFDRDAINRLRPRAKLAAIKAHRRGEIDRMPDRAGLDQISVAMLSRAMNGDQTVLSACATEAESVNLDAE